ncbi:MAG: 50S ribosomal protein L21 [Magnetococcales bacterium]|nr:50S ribosomal protein L21 [Magnetococcales bacterium]
MYAVVRSGGKQYKVAVDDVLRVEQLDGEVGDEVTLADVLMVSEDGAIKAGEAIDGITVSGAITRHGRGKKITVFKKKRRKNYIRKQGHRQNFTELKITSIQ